MSGLSNGNHFVLVRQIDDAGNVSDIGTSSSWTIDTTAAPIEPPAVLTPRPGTKTVYLKTVDGKLTWAMKLGVLFSTGGDTRSVARLLTVQVAVDSLGRPVSAKPSDRQPLPSAATFLQGVVAWDGSGEVRRPTAAAPVWVRVGNGAGKWTGWVKLTQ